MALLVNSGRAGLAAALKMRTMHFAWGRGNDWWGATEVKAATFSGAPEQIALDHAPIKSVSVKDPDSAQTYEASIDYAVDFNTGVITRINGGSIAPGATVQLQVVYGTTPLAADANALVDEVGRRVAATVEFVNPDPEGNINTPGGQRWTISTEATRYLYVSVLFDYLEASDETIREVGIFVNTEREAGVPEGQLYLTPEEVADPGYLLLLDRFAGKVRSPSERQGFSYVLVI
ncbi:hypothetical protein [Rhodopseudomonas palustris]|uniref:hypothetical protein n=1 Tax=Rhodopseudomonas palustris TaxID=1076 RepID=UPI0006427CB8|nr:hypothetical protein [Rhodopseudomonas palustris]